MVDELTFKRELNDIQDELVTYHNTNGAYQLFKLFGEKYADLLVVTDTEDTIHRYFSDTIAMTLFNAIDAHDWSVEVEHLALPISQYYFIKAELLDAKDDNYAEALLNYGIGLTLEPTNVPAALKVVALATRHQDWPTVQKWATYAWQYAYQVADVAAVFEALANYTYSYQHNAHVGVVLLTISCAFNETNGRIAKLSTWNEQLSLPLDDLTDADFALVTDAGLPINYNEAIEVALTEFGTTLLEMELTAQAKTLYQDLLTLTDDEDYAEILSEL
ncbi:hypothetical protein JOC59_000054 [Weissella beninensis]|uniref:Uncharacterized protein n=1 Tax=Periweissella beninensis TaxID=504936 RepID=A0ABT0VI86_9LACO|nr:hypothetical protein [Periweissella beninensis]MBM7543358.1 hypothetical protein [Periweissella beninensis]MCM2437345.1 hypothetical protein [Periweissella beninensis]